MIELKKDEETSIKGPYGEIDLVITPCTAKENTKPVLIMAHGFRGSMEGGGRAKYLADLAGEIAHVVRFNFNGSQILSKQIAELEKVVTYAKKRFEGSRIVLLGRSMGGCAALVAASRDTEIKGLVLWATPNDLHLTFLNSLGKAGYLKLKNGENLYLNDERGELVLTPEFLRDVDRYDLIELLRNWKKRPLLVIHGANDETVPLVQGQQSYFLAGLPKRLVVIPNADHSFTNHGHKAAEEVVSWLQHILI
ncbi:MAG: alpha/beta hydrolase family protein [Acidaminococcaceae bacterium]